LSSLTLLVTIPSSAASLCNAISNNLVLNCGFENGDFSDWTRGNIGFEAVNSTSANSGNFGAQFGPVGVDGTLSQVITDAAGTVSFDFWLRNDGGSPNDFSVEWNGVVVDTANTPISNASPFSYTEQGPVTLTSTGSDTLEFFFRQDNSFWRLDDVSVVQATTTATTPEPTSILIALLGLCAMACKKRADRTAG
jgi:hypothetical protein